MKTRPTIRKSGQPYTPAQRKRNQRRREKQEGREQSSQAVRKRNRQLRDEADQALRETITPEVSINHCAIEEVDMSMLADSSVDAIITDPPYSADALPVMASLAEFAERKLKPSGWCVVMIGSILLPEIVTHLSAKLIYRGMYCVVTPGGKNSRLAHLGAFQSWKPVLLYQKAPASKIREWWPDIITAKAADQDKSLHKWQQSEAVFRELVNRFSRPGDLIVDPFAGSGTTGRAALALGRHFWGCDADSRCVLMAAE
jgi:16S rRNA G966 N2-methylase RsmD